MWECYLARRVSPKTSQITKLRPCSRLSEGGESYGRATGLHEDVAHCFIVVGRHVNIDRRRADVGLIGGVVERG